MQCKSINGWNDVDKLSWDGDPSQLSRFFCIQMRGSLTLKTGGISSHYEPPSHWHMVIVLHFGWLFSSHLFISVPTLLSSDWMYCIIAFHLLLFVTSSFNYDGGGEENACSFCWSLPPPSVTLKFNMWFCSTCDCWSQWLHVRDSGYFTDSLLE